MIKIRKFESMIVKLIKKHRFYDILANNRNARRIVLGKSNFRSVFDRIRIAKYKNIGYT